MSEYIITNGTFYNSDNLTHYGVLGMKWGVRRNTKRLSSGDGSGQAKAVKALNKHRAKASGEIAKLQQKNVKLEKRNERNIIKAEPKAAKLNKQAANYRRKATGIFVSDRRAQKYLSKAYLAETKARDLTARANEVRVKIQKNKMLIKTFERGISEIDTALADKGRKYING